jgi:AcrR family transcriptional regulator
MSVPSLGRRRTYLKADVRRAQILEVAKDLFARRGYRVANVADICEAAHIGRGTLYQYFDNKQAVLLALMEDLAERVRRLLEERPKVAAIPGADRAPPELIVAFCKGRLRAVLDAVFIDESTLRLVLREARGLDGAVDQVITLIDELLIAAMVDDIRAAQSAGIVRKGDPVMIARFLLGGVEKVVLSALLVDTPVDLDGICQTAVELELFGILNVEKRR